MARPGVQTHTTARVVQQSGISPAPNFKNRRLRAVPASSWQIPMDSFKVVKAAAKAAKGRAPQLQYPRLALFRQILRAHERHLPAAHRELGDAYVREEFRAHRKASVRRARLPKHTSCK